MLLMILLYQMMNQHPQFPWLGTETNLKKVRRIFYIDFSSFDTLAPSFITEFV